MAAFSSNWRAKPDASSLPDLNTPSTNQTDKLSESLSRHQKDKGVKMPTASEVEIRGEDDPRTLQAVEEGRRLYVGNLPYLAGAKEVKDLFMSHHYDIEHINISIDPFTGRNPSYCFVELGSKALADRAMEELNGKNVRGRPVKLGPGKAGKSKKRQRPSNDAPGYRDQAYGRSSRQRSSRIDRCDRYEPSFQRWTRIDAPDHWEGYIEEGRRLWVGGLPQMSDHGSVNQGVRELFKGFNIEAVSKVIIPRDGFGHPDAGDHRYLFVDFPSAEEARLAVRATNGRRAWGVEVRVALAKPVTSGKALEAKKLLGH